MRGENARTHIRQHLRSLWGSDGWRRLRVRCRRERGEVTAKEVLVWIWELQLATDLLTAEETAILAETVQRARREIANAKVDTDASADAGTAQGRCTGTWTQATVHPIRASV